MAAPPGPAIWFKQSVSIKNQTGLSNEGKPTYGAGSATPCLINNKKVWVKNPFGGEIYSQTQITVAGDTTVAAQDEITMPDTTTALVISVQDLTGPDGSTWYKVILT